MLNCFGLTIGVSMPSTIINYCSQTEIAGENNSIWKSSLTLSHSCMVAANNAHLLRYCPPERKAITAARTACFSWFLLAFLLVCSVAGALWLETQLRAPRRLVQPLIVLFLGTDWDLNVCCFTVRCDGGGGTVSISFPWVWSTVQQVGRRCVGLVLPSRFK